MVHHLQVAVLRQLSHVKHAVAQVRLPIGVQDPDVGLILLVPHVHQLRIVVFKHVQTVVGLHRFSVTFGFVLVVARLHS